MGDSMELYLSYETTVYSIEEMRQLTNRLLQIISYICNHPDEPITL